jgi:hypothetical protein
MRPEARKARVAGLLFGLGLIGGLAAGAPSRAADAPQEANTVSEVVVIANRPPTVEELAVVARAECLPPKPEKGSAPPKVVSSYPRQGQEIRPGLVILRVTFDKPMACSGFFAVLPSREKNPCSGAHQDFSRQNFLMSYDRKTIRVPCVVEAGKSYTLGLNEMNVSPVFNSLQQRLLTPYRMNFKTSSAAPIQTIPDALSADPETVLADVYRPARRTQAAASPP